MQLCHPQPRKRIRPRLIWNSCIINILMALALPFWPVWFSRVVVGLGWVNPFSILFVLLLRVQVMMLIGGPVVLIDGGLFDEG